MEQTSSIVTPGTVIGVGNTVGILFTSIYLYNKVNQINEELTEVHDQMAKQIEIVTRMNNNNDLRDQFDDYSRNVKNLTEINNDLRDRLSSLEELYYQEHNELKEIKKFLTSLGYTEKSNIHESILRNRDSKSDKRYISDYENSDRYTKSSNYHTITNRHTNKHNKSDRHTDRYNKSDRHTDRYNESDRHTDRYNESDRHTDGKTKNRNEIQRSLNINGQKRKDMRIFKEESENHSESDDDIITNIKKLNS